MSLEPYRLLYEFLKIYLLINRVNSYIAVYGYNGVILSKFLMEQLLGGRWRPFSKCLFCVTASSALSGAVASKLYH